jgi:hypothetical protein
VTDAPGGSSDRVVSGELGQRPLPQTFGGIQRVFTSWSDGGARTRNITATDDATLTATFTR